jgi:aminocarboxymuconate-semialdehyde decarboxylase
LQPDACPHEATIDAHAHFIPRGVLEALRRAEFDSVRLVRDDDELRFAFAGLPTSPPAPRIISDLAAAGSDAATHGVRARVVGPWTDMFGYTLAAAEGDRWTRTMNEALAAEAKQHQGTHALGSVCLQHPDLAAEQVRHIAELEMAGIMIGTSAPGMLLDDPRLDQLWEALVDLALPAFIHPIFLAVNAELDDYGLANAVGRSNATTLSIARVLLGGVLQRHPDLKLVISHGGAGVPNLLARIARSHALDPSASSDPMEGFARLYFDSVVLDPKVLRSLIDIAGAERIMLGSDWPFPWSPRPMHDVGIAELDEQVQCQVLHRTAKAVFALPTDEKVPA